MIAWKNIGRRDKTLTHNVFVWRWRRNRHHVTRHRLYSEHAAVSIKDILNLYCDCDRRNLEGRVEKRRVHGHKGVHRKYVLYFKARTLLKHDENLSIIA